MIYVGIFVVVVGGCVICIVFGVAVTADVVISSSLLFVLS